MSSHTQVLFLAGPGGRRLYLYEAGIAQSVERDDTSVEAASSRLAACSNHEPFDFG